MGLFRWTFEQVSKKQSGDYCITTLKGSRFFPPGSTTIYEKEKRDCQSIKDPGSGGGRPLKEEEKFLELQNFLKI